MIPFLHRWVSQRVLHEAGFAPNVVTIVGETSRWTDWYRWLDNIANAATPTDAHGTPMDPAAASVACAKTLQGHLRNIETSRLNEQLVWLGFALHLAQDLAAHQGRTDPEHALQVYLILPNPDWRPAAIRRGLRYSRHVVATVRQRLGDRFGELQAGTGARLLTPKETTTLLGPKDFTWPNFWQAMSTFRHYFKTPKVKRRIRWDTERVLAEGLGR